VIVLITKAKKAVGTTAVSHDPLFANHMISDLGRATPTDENTLPAQPVFIQHTSLPSGGVP
jgi:hypothetical protein